ncbi:sodium:solute symporter [Metallumcola ferriviriculae]|uniref:Sodium:solute symporter n=1 Tax=Metallumcola ferriviriculae TaxID=3039180 RepID=A0AAU0UIX2_9FIRM|nr:sodium:solute symporter [Desulfitibacteraceae bacterium MK1]
MKFTVIAIYVFVVMGIAVYSMRKTKTEDDFILGNRSIGPWVSAFAYGTTYFSAVLFIGYAGKVGWGFGMSGLWIVLGNALVGGYLAWKVLAKPTRRMTTRLGSRTMPEFLEARFNCKSMKIVSALIIFTFLVPYSASVYMGLSYFFEEIFHIAFGQALLFIAILTGAYLVMGGYFAITMTDFVQGIVMMFGVILLIFYVVTDAHVGGLSAGLEKLAAIEPRLVQPVGPPGILPLLSLVILTSLGAWGLPQMVQKFYAIESEQSIPQAMTVTTVFAFLMTLGAYFTGGFSRLFFDNQMPLGPGGQPSPDVIMPQIISQALPEIVGVILLLLVLAASMSTLASLVLVSSSAIVVDLVQGTMKPDMDRKHVVLLLRVFCVIFIGLSVYLALTPTVILTLMSISWGTVAGAFLAPYLYGLYWRGTTLAGAWAGIISGLSISLGLSIYTHMDAQLIPMIGSLAIVAPLVIVPAVSAVTSPYSHEHLAKVFGEEYQDGQISSEGLMTHDLG